MKKLLKEYGLNSDMQYFEMIVESFNNGSHTQARTQFANVPKKDRVAFLRSATVEGWESGLSRSKLATLFDLL